MSSMPDLPRGVSAAGRRTNVRFAAVSFFLLLAVPWPQPLASGEPLPVYYEFGGHVEVWDVPPPAAPEVQAALDDPVQEQVMDALLELGYTPIVFECVAVIFRGESSWRPDIVAPDTGGFSYGLGQRHAPTWGAPPQPWPVADQVAWFSDYAEDRYGGWCPAADRWLDRAQKRGGAGWW